MGFVSTKNLLAPFSNKVHLVTILLVFLLFVSLRLSGGALRIVDADSDVTTQRTRSETAARTSATTRADVQRRGVTRSPAATRGRTAPPPARGGERDRALQEIEAELGLD